MDKKRIFELFSKALELTELSLEYEFRFGAGNPVINSPDEAWHLSQIVFDKQVEIVSLLDHGAFLLDAGLQGFQKFGGSMSSNLAAEIHIVVLQLYLLAAKQQIRNDPPETNEQLFKQYQRTIAGMLDPKAVRKVMVDYGQT